MTFVRSRRKVLLDKYRKTESRVVIMFLIFIASIVISLLVIGTAVFQLLWNLTMPQVFGLRQIGFSVAFRLLLIAGILSSAGLLKFNLGG